MNINIEYKDKYKHKYEYNWPINNQHRNNEQIIKIKSSEYVSRSSHT